MIKSQRGEDFFYFSNVNINDHFRTFNIMRMYTTVGSVCKFNRDYRGGIGEGRFFFFASLRTPFKTSRPNRFRRASLQRGNTNRRQSMENTIGRWVHHLPPNNQPQCDPLVTVKNKNLRNRRGKKKEKMYKEPNGQNDEIPSKSPAPPRPRPIAFSNGALLTRKGYCIIIITCCTIDGNIFFAWTNSRSPYNIIDFFFFLIDVRSLAVVIFYIQSVHVRHMGAYYIFYYYFLFFFRYNALENNC